MRYLLLFLFSVFISNAQTQILEQDTTTPIAFATISFGNGNGIFADDDGKFTFTKKLYKDIDTIFVSALGYKELKVATINLKPQLFLEHQADQLTEVLVVAKPKGKFKKETLKPISHDDYHKCWLPTIESEIAIYFPKKEKHPIQIKEVLIPIKTEAKQWRKRNKKGSKKRPFSTLFKVNFYENNNGKPGDVLTYETITFIANQETDSHYTLNVEESDLFIPDNGVFVSIQIMGFTDPKGKLLPNKKYREIKTKKGIVKVSTTFRPLLPFTDKVEKNNTYIKRIFLNKNKWVNYNKTNIKKSNLLSQGLNNYGMGITTKVYYQD